jgi:hypothetical protein
VSRLVPVGLAVALMVAGGGCAKAKGGSGAGQDVSLCTAFKLYDDLAEPSPEDPAAVRRYAQTTVRIYDRVDSHIKIDGHDIPPVVMARVKQIITSMRHFDSAYGKASTRGERLQAEADLVADKKLDRALAAITIYTKDQCVKKSLIPDVTTPTTTK